MSPERNSYCERLGLPVPRLEDVVDRKQVRLFHLMVAALLERGRPMGLDDLAERLRAAGVVAGSGDLALSLKKAWHGMEPVYRDAQGHFGLNLSSAALEYILRTAGLRAPRFAAPAPPPGAGAAVGRDTTLRERAGRGLPWSLHLRLLGAPAGRRGPRCAGALGDGRGRGCVPRPADAAPTVDHRRPRAVLAQRACRDG